MTRNIDRTALSDGRGLQVAACRARPGGASVRSLAAIILALCLLALAPAAWSTPPDPLWFKGIYDEGEHGALVTAVAVVVELLPLVRHVPIIGPTSPSADASGVRSVWLTPSHGRSPPAPLRAS